MLVDTKTLLDGTDTLVAGSSCADTTASPAIFVGCVYVLQMLFVGVLRVVLVVRNIVS